MIKVEKSILIKTPREKVWEVLSNLEERPKWDDNIKEAKITSEKKRGEGTKVHILAAREIMGKPVEMEMLVTEWRKNNGFSAKMISGPLSNANMSFFLEDKGENTMLMVNIQIEPSFLLKTVMGGKIEGEIKKMADSILNNLKEYVE